MGHPAPFSVFLFFFFFPPAKLAKTASNEGDPSPPAPASAVSFLSGSPDVTSSLRCHRRLVEERAAAMETVLPVRFSCPSGCYSCVVKCNDNNNDNKKMIKIQAHGQVVVRFVPAACQINIIALSELKKTCRQNS